MLDNQLIQLFLPIISTGLIANGYENIALVAGNQPTSQGVNTGPTVYFYKLHDVRYGFKETSDKYDEVLQQEIHTELQQYETTFQVSALVIANPLVVDTYTASDLVNQVAAILQSDSAIETLNASDVGIYRIRDSKNPYFIDDKDRAEANPLIEFTLTHKQVNISVIPVLDSIQTNIYRV